MPQPIAICVEDLQADPHAERYVRCVAVPGNRPGLSVTAGGAVAWQQPEGCACELCVSGDGRLLLWRPAGATALSVHRAGRSLEVPFEKPVMLLDQDEISTGSRRLRIHVHGTAPAVHPPKALPPRGREAALALVAAVAIGSAAAACDKTEIEVRDHPPAVAEPLEPDAGAQPDAAAGAQPDAAAGATSAAASATATTSPTGTSAPATSATGQAGKAPPIEVRPSPPRMAPPDD